MREGTIVVIVSDSHIGGDPGCDGFESPEELRSLFEDLSRCDGPVELVLAGDFFDFLQIGHVPEGMDRASLTTSRREYQGMFSSLRRFREKDGNRVVYLPGNHDAESFWNPEIQETLKAQGLVDEFAFYYLATVKTGRGRRTIYCEHGNQLDPANAVEDYSDSLDTPLGHHVVTDFTRRVAPFGEVSRGLDLSEIKMVYPLVAIPAWILGRYFYALVGKVAAYLLLPLLAAYVVYRITAYSLVLASGGRGFFGAPRELPRVHLVFLDIAIFGLLLLIAAGVFFLVIRRAVRRTAATMSPGREPRYSPAEASRRRIRAILKGERKPPMNPSLDPTTIDVFVSGHTHLPSLETVENRTGEPSVLVNSGCWLRQLQPVSPHLKGPPVFVSRFVLTWVAISPNDTGLSVELWEYPKPARQRLSRIERAISWRRIPEQPPPGSKPRVRAKATV